MSNKDKNRNLTRVNISLTKELKDWYQKKAYELGLSMSSYMMISLDKMREQAVISEKIDDVLQKLKILENEKELKKFQELLKANNLIEK